jgi:hypothetical protein
MKLNARQVETAKPKDKSYKMADGGGLYLDNRMRFTNPGECNAPPGDRPLP